MVLLLDTQLEEIAEFLELGERVFVNKATGNIITHPKFDVDGYDMKEYFEGVLKELENNFDNYWEVEQLTSTDNFQIMEEFADQLSDTNQLKKKLIKALCNKKPFSNFKFEIDNSGTYRDHWFEFKNEKHKKWVFELYRIEKQKYE